MMKNIGPIARIRPSAVLTASYVASLVVDLINHNAVSLSAVVTGNEAATAYLKFQWGKIDETGAIVWADEPIMDGGAAAAGEYHQTPLARVVDVTLDNTDPNYKAAYTERFNRLSRFFRVLTKGSGITTTGKLEIVVESLNN